MGREDRKKGTSDQRKMSCVDCKGEDGAILPGFRFHPTDEELVGFYLRRKVENKPAVTDIIKQMDIYKHDPWDLPNQASNYVGEKEWYFFCLRGRKYRNSVRPNRVTGSGFWKATGIDRPIYYMSQDTNHCIGLKKSLVYYRGSAGKGMKTDWMMHEFRLPNTKTSNNPRITISKQEAEIWTLCRIFKKSNSSKRSVAPNLGKLSQTQSTLMCTTTRSELIKDITSDYFGEYPVQQNEMKSDNNHSEKAFSSAVEDYEATPLTTSHPGIPCSNLGSSFSGLGNFDELRAVVDSAIGSRSYSPTESCRR